MAVGSWDPGAEATLTDEVVAELIAAAQSSEEKFGLDADAVTRLAAVARHSPTCDWVTVAGGLETGALEQLLRLYTLAERLPGWEAGSKSPVVALAAELRRRDAFPKELLSWVKSNTDNRFLPYGDLMDRL